MINKSNYNKSNYQVNNSTQIKQSALECLKNDLSVIPLNDDKTPTVEWQKYQSKIMSIDEAEKLFDNAYGVGLVCGGISGNIEVIDVDIKNDNKDNLCKIYLETLKNDLTENIFSKLVISKTVNGGYHIFYRYNSDNEYSDICLNPYNNLHQLKEFKPCLYFTRRIERCYVVIPPTPGYELIQGSFTKISPISYFDRNDIFLHAKFIGKYDKQERLLVL